MNQSINKFIKEAKNDINYLSQLKNEVKVKKISSTSDMYFKYLYTRTSGIEYHKKYKRIITKKLKHFIMVNYYIPVTPNYKIMYHLKNLAIDHLKLDFNFHYFERYLGISPLTQLTTLIYLLKFINIKKITLCISIFRHFCPEYDLFCKS